MSSLPNNSESVLESLGAIPKFPITPPLNNLLLNSLTKVFDSTYEAVKTINVHLNLLNKAVVELKLKSNANLKFQRINELAIIPHRATNGSAGLDLHSVVDLVIPPGGQGKVATGLKSSFNDTHYVRIASRSGLSVKNRIEVGAGVIDADFFCEWMVVLNNLGDVPFVVHVGDRIAQAVICRISNEQPEEVQELSPPNSNRVGGFGSTGVSSSDLI